MLSYFTCVVLVVRPLPRSTAYVKVRYHGHIFQKKAVMLTVTLYDTINNVFKTL